MLLASVLLGTTSLQADEVEYKLAPGIGLLISSEEWERNHAPGDSGEVLVRFVVRHIVGTLLSLDNVRTMHI